MRADDPATTTAAPPATIPEGAAPTRSQKRTRLAREQRIQHILDVSQRLFATHAYDAIAIEDLAAAAGMSKGLLYHYYAGKRELYVATARHALEHVLQSTDLHPDLHAGLSETLSLFERYPGLAKLVFRGGIGSDAEVEALIADHRQRRLTQLFHGLGFAGALSDAQPLVLLGLRGWLSLLEDVCLQWVQQPDVTRDQVVAFLKRSLHAILTSTLPGQEWSLDGAREHTPWRTEPATTALAETALAETALAETALAETGYPVAPNDRLAGPERG